MRATLIGFGVAGTASLIVVGLTLVARSGPRNLDSASAHVSSASGVLTRVTVSMPERDGVETAAPAGGAAPQAPPNGGLEPGDPSAQGADGPAGLPGRPSEGNPSIDDFEPTIAGIGSKIRIRGKNLGRRDHAAVRFAGGVITTWIEEHGPEEIVVRVPLGAEPGPVEVVTGVPSATDLAAMDPLRRGRAVENARTATTRDPLTIVMPFVLPVESDGLIAKGSLLLHRSRLIVDLEDFLGFPDAVRIAARIGGRVAGFIAPSNSYVIALDPPPADLDELERIMDRIQSDGAVVEVGPDIAVQTRQVAFADSDVVRRYRFTDGTDPTDMKALDGREDAWAWDRIQAPAAWHLIRRFVPRLHAVRVAVMDSGCNQNHEEFSGVALRKVVPAEWAEVRITGGLVELPLALAEAAYDLGDIHLGWGHGTAVTSLIGARNGLAIGGNPGGDRGMNGLLGVNGGAYTIQVYRTDIAFESTPRPIGVYDFTTGLLATINSVAITTPAAERPAILNVSFGVGEYAIDPTDDPADPREPIDYMRIALRKVARQLNLFRNEVLLCQAVANAADDPRAYNGGEIVAFEDLNLNGQLDGGEDSNGNGVLDHGNSTWESLGLLPNVIAVGAIGGADLDPAPPDPLDPCRPNERWARDDNRATFSHWGRRVPGSLIDPLVQVAAPGVEVFAARLRDTVPETACDNILIGGQVYGRDTVTGTSFATPLVAGSAALLRSIDNTLTPARIKARLIASAYPVTTRDGRGNVIVWNTLKVGAAVRQLLVDLGLVMNDQQWSGTSKILFRLGATLTDPGIVYVAEVRQNAATKRSEFFGLRRVFDAGFDATADSLALSHDGRYVAFTWEDDFPPIVNESRLYTYDFAAGGGTPDLRLSSPDTVAVFGIVGAARFLPSQYLLFPVLRHVAYPCGGGTPDSVETWAPHVEGQPIQECLRRPDNAIRQRYEGDILDFAARSDNRLVRLRYASADHRYDGGCNQTTVSFGEGDMDFPHCSTNDLRIEHPPNPSSLWNHAWSHDGRMLANLRLDPSEDRILVSDYPVFTDFEWDVGILDSGDLNTRLTWSPDGSEWAWPATSIAGNYGVVTRPRRQPLVDPPAHVFTEFPVPGGHLQWQW